MRWTPKRRGERESFGKGGVPHRRRRGKAGQGEAGLGREGRAGRRDRLRGRRAQRLPKERRRALRESLGRLVKLELGLDGRGAG